MRILYLCHRVPFPPRRGGKIRPFHMIQHLHANHEVTVASLARSKREAHEADGLRAFCARTLVERVGAASSVVRMILRLPTLQPSSMGYFFSRRLAQRIRSELEVRPPELIFVHCSSVAPYVAGVRGPRKILDFGDMDSQKWLAIGRTKRLPLSLGYYAEGLKMQLAEMDLAQRFDFCTCTTRAELQTLRGYGVETPSDWFPNGVDTEYYHPTGEPYEADTLCFVGRMDYFPNQQGVIEFCRETLPRIRARRPSALLRIVGADPPARIRRLAEQPGVEVTGSVPDVRPYVGRAALTVAPLNIARGTQNKILESLAMGVPCVCSGLAAGGVDAVPGEHILAARTPAEFAAAVLYLLGDRAARRRFAEAGRSRMLTHHAWSSSLRKLDEIVDGMMERRTMEWTAEGRR